MNRFRRFIKFAFGTTEGTLYFFEMILLLISSISGICLLCLQLS